MRWVVGSKSILQILPILKGVYSVMGPDEATTSFTIKN